MRPEAPAPAEVSEAGPAGARPDPARPAPGPAGVALSLLQRLAPLVIGIPVLAGIVATLGHLASTRYPNLGWALAVASDGKALALGQLPYADPAHHYTGMLYAPLFPAVLAPLYAVFWWDGWPIAVAAGSGVVLAAIAGWLAIGPRLGRGWVDHVVDVLTAVGVGGIAWWIVSANYRNLLYEGRSDQFAWLLALAGLVVLAALVARRSPRVWPAVALLTAAVWTKQTTVGAAAAAGLLLTWWTVRGVVARRTWIRFTVGLAVANVATLAALLLVTRGWLWYFMFVMPQRHWRDSALAPYARELRDLVALPVALVVVSALVALRPRGWSWAALRAWRRSVVGDVRAVRHRPADDAPRAPIDLRVALVALLVLFAICSLPPTLTGRRKQGGEANQYIGVQWALAFLFAIAYRAARRTPARMAAALGVVALLVATVHVDAIRSRVEDRGVALPSTHPDVEFGSIPPDYRVYAATHRVYHPYLGDLDAESFHELWPTVQNIADLLAAGEEPGYLVDALVERRFDAVAPFDTAGDPYVSAYGKTEENFLWKLNRVIASGYDPSVGDVPTGLLGRRPGPTAEPWLATCFGPFAIGGEDWLIHQGGGLWCRAPGSATIALEETPAPVTEVRTEGGVRATGSVAVSLRSGVGAVEVRFGEGADAEVVRVTAGPAPDTVTVATSGPSGTTEPRPVPTVAVGAGRGVNVLVGPARSGDAEVHLPVAADARRRLHVVASGDSRAFVDLSQLDLRG